MSTVESVTIVGDLEHRPKNKSSQRFTFTDSQGLHRHYLLMPSEAHFCASKINSGEWTLEQALERETGYYNASNITLEIIYHG
jgi:hypothetical protein